MKRLAVGVVIASSLGSMGTVIAGDATQVVEDAALKRMDLSRYAAMSQNSPFALETPAPTKQETQPSFAANWYVTGLGRLGHSDFVTIKARDLSVQFSLYAGDVDSGNDVRLVSVDWSETVGKSTVTIRKGAEVARLEFNEAELRAPVGAKAPAAGGVGVVDSKGASAGGSRGSSVAYLAPGGTPPPVPRGKVAPRPLRVLVPPAGGQSASAGNAVAPVSPPVRVNVPQPRAVRPGGAVMRPGAPVR